MLPSNFNVSKTMGTAHECEAGRGPLAQVCCQGRALADCKHPCLWPRVSCRAGHISDRKNVGRAAAALQRGADGNKTFVICTQRVKDLTL